MKALFSLAALVVAEKDVQETELEIDGPVIGIDLGTTYSCVGIYKNGRVEIIPNDQGNRITPSYVAFVDGERLVGEAAKNQATINPAETLFDVKRLIGRAFTDSTVQRDKRLLPYALVEKGRRLMIEVDVKGKKKTLTPEEVSSMILTKMKMTAENYLGQEVNHAVITVPAYFNDAQRSATKNAGTIAGLNVVRIINEPTAAAIAYGLDKQMERNILVYDLGGGTFDVSLLTIDNGVFEVVSTAGDTHLGGEDFDQRVMTHFIKVFKKKTGKDMTKDKRALQKLRREVEKAKRQLSSTHMARVEIEALFDGEDLSEQLTRAKFEELCLDLFKKTLKPVEQALEDAYMTGAQVDDVVLVGGSTRIPKVQELLTEFFNDKELNRGVNPDEAVAYGAAIQAGVLSGVGADTGILVLDVTPLTLGVETLGGMMTKLIPRNTVIPTKKSQSFSTTVDNQATVGIVVYEGERPMVKDNHKLGNFDLTGIPPAPRGLPQIEVTFEIDSNGILIVTASDKGTGRKKGITIKNDKGRLSEQDIERMIKDAEIHAKEDLAIKEKADAKNSLDSYISSLQSTLDGSQGLGAKMDGAEKKIIRDAIQEAQGFVTDNPQASAEEIKDKQKDVEAVASPVISKYYQGGSSSGGQQSSGGDDGGEQADYQGAEDDDFYDEL